MVDVVRRHGLIAFMLALALVGLFKAASQWTAGRQPAWAGAVLLLLAIAIQELERRELVRGSAYLSALRWCGVLGALGFLIGA